MMERRTKRVAGVTLRLWALELSKVVRTRDSKVSQDLNQSFGRLSQDGWTWISFHWQSHPISKRAVLTSGRVSRGKFPEYFKDRGWGCDRWMNSVMYSFWHRFPIHIVVQRSEFAKDAQCQSWQTCEAEMGNFLSSNIAYAKICPKISSGSRRSSDTTAANEAWHWIRAASWWCYVFFHPFASRFQSCPIKA